MTRALQVVFLLSLAMCVFWTVIATMAQGAGGLGAVLVFIVIYPLFGCFAVFALWAMWKRPEQRKIAGWIIGMPVIGWFLPKIFRSALGGAMSTQHLIILALAVGVVVIVYAWVAPKKAARIVPGGLVRSRLFNWIVLLGLMGAWAFLVVVIGYVFIGDSSSVPSSSTAVGYAVVAGALYSIALGFGSFGVATWAWLSLKGGFQETARKLNIAQVVVAAPGIIVGVGTAVWLVGQGQL